MLFSNVCYHSAQQFQVPFFSYKLLPEFDLMGHYDINLCLFLIAVPTTTEVICPPLLPLLPGPFYEQAHIEHSIIHSHIHGTHYDVTRMNCNCFIILNADSNVIFAVLGWCDLPFDSQFCL